MSGFSRRRLLRHAGAAALVGALRPELAQGDETPAGDLESIEHRGRLIAECSLAGERRSDDIVPAHPNGIQASKNRWLLVYASRGFRGVDDDRSLIYQLRHGSPEGSLVKEGRLVATLDDWDPLLEGKRYVKQHGHPVLFGVPLGARVRGKPAASAGVFVLKWRQTARFLDHAKKELVKGPEDEAIRARTQTVGWLQFRLNDREDDVEILQTARLLRQRGYETGTAFCSAPGVTRINQTYTQAVPFSADGSAWADVNYFDNGRAAALKYVFNPRAGLYEWRETGPFLFGDQRPVTEPSLARWKDGWVVAARVERRGILWTRTPDPFASPGETLWVETPPSPSPRTAYLCPDGVLRLLTNDPARSPTKQMRDPLYLFDVDPGQGFRVTGARVVFDASAAGLPLRRAASPMIDMAKLLPHGGGRVQYLLHRVIVQSHNHPYRGGDGDVRPEIPIINAQEKAAAGIYCAKLTYRDPHPGVWEL